MIITSQQYYDNLNYMVNIRLKCSDIHTKEKKMKKYIWHSLISTSMSRFRSTKHLQQMFCIQTDKKQSAQHFVFSYDTDSKKMCYRKMTLNYKMWGIMQYKNKTKQTKNFRLRFFFVPKIYSPETFNVMWTWNGLIAV